MISTTMNFSANTCTLKPLTSFKKVTVSNFLEMVDTNEVESHLIDRYEIRRRLGKFLFNFAKLTNSLQGRVPTALCGKQMSEKRDELLR